MDVVKFCSDLIKYESVTPNDNGILEYIKSFLDKIGFQTKILEFSHDVHCIKNLFAKYIQDKGKSLGFLGHSDVVPAGEGWNTSPFVPVIKNDYLIGRGVADMKGGIAAFCCAVSEFIKLGFKGEIRFFITGDEEIGSYQGTRSLLKWAIQNKELPIDCLIGEPSSKREIGDRIYIGHRGSINVNVCAIGKQGHVAYPENYNNALMRICSFISEMKNYSWKYNDKRYPKTNLEPTLLYVGNYAENIVPGSCSANINIRFGADYTLEELERIFFNKAKQYDLHLNFRRSGEAYCCDNSELINLLSNSIYKITNIKPEISTAGGISDGRYMISYCNVIEFGLQDITIHQPNEKIKINDLQILKDIYFQFLKDYFNA